MNRRGYNRFSSLEEGIKSARCTLNNPSSRSVRGSIQRRMSFESPTSKSTPK